MSTAGEHRFNQMYDRVEALVRKRVRKYNLETLDPDDLMQEGRLAAAYAVDTFQTERGNLDGYISTVVNNALAMVAAERLAQSRQPYKLTQELDGTWKRSPSTHVELEPDDVMDDTKPSTHTRESARDLGDQSSELAGILDGLKLGCDARRMLQVRLNTPPELWILARNINRGRMRIEANSVCCYLGWILDFNGEPDRLRYQRALRELREAFRGQLGVDEMTYEPITSGGQYRPKEQRV